MNSKPLVLTLSLLSTSVFAQERLASQVIKWSEQEVIERPVAQQRKILETTTPTLSLFKVHATTLFPKGFLKEHYTQANEEMLIIKEGVLHLTINGVSKNLPAGSLALIMPEDTRKLENISSQNVTYYVFQFFSKDSTNTARGKSSGGSVMIPWEEAKFIENPKGGRKDFLNRPTNMLNRLEVHTTMLNPGIMSHAAHTHLPAEIILPIQLEMGSSHVEEYINEKTHAATDGDVIFLQSMDLHGIKNVGKKQVTYFAFQFD